MFPVWLGGPQLNPSNIPKKYQAAANSAAGKDDSIGAGGVVPMQMKHALRMVEIDEMKGKSLQ
jgi:hypothetical protein